MHACMYVGTYIQKVMYGTNQCVRVCVCVFAEWRAVVGVGWNEEALYLGAWACGA
jgi:hypothetical protein